MVRVVLGIVIGVAVAMASIFVVEAIGHLLYPPPVGADMKAPDAVAAYIATAPLMALAFPPIGWLLGAAVGGWAARHITRRHWAGWVVALVVLAGGIINLFLIPAPLWMQIAAIAAPLLGGLIATRLPIGSHGIGKDQARAQVDGGGQ